MKKEFYYLVDANESLLGRIENIYVLPLTFNQFMNFYMTYISKSEDIIIPKLDLNNIEKSFKELEKYYYDQELKMKIQKILKSLLKQKEIDDNLAGHIVESMVDFDCRLLCEKENYKQYYYRNTDKEEIDIILDKNVSIVPIEVKYTNQIETKGLKTINNFIETHKDNSINKVEYGIIITKDIYKKEGNFYFVPYWLLNL